MTVRPAPEELAARLPRLFAPSRIDYANCEITFTVDPVPDDAINRLHLLAITADGGVVVCESVEGWRFLPGGRREPGESVDELAHREAMEEAGLRLDGPPVVFGAHVAVSGDPVPHRDHFAHPLGYWAYAHAPATVVAAPTSPPDAEQITGVHTLPADRAIDFLEQHDPDHADVVRLAVLTGIL
ncbi:NUDIX domain-containing protein [Microlunatus parietis]|uniref:8-oxo-dGTP diphosphatase n=1 Tax=Microlunatus parietis TaxID=682979 RepID=A0A7Y9I1Y7_9ACTN|nr:NUDIX domain-containing protein [Microlunatus parietis]NYE68726.1 8-oxo-dGTP diphosphatase [Microlunatus parietis]